MIDAFMYVYYIWVLHRYISVFLQYGYACTKFNLIRAPKFSYIYMCVCVCVCVL